MVSQIQGLTLLFGSLTDFCTERRRSSKVDLQSLDFVNFRIDWRRALITTDALEFDSTASGRLGSMAYEDYRYVSRDSNLGGKACLGKRYFG